jgi:hypothetical protein
MERDIDWTCIPLDLQPPEIAKAVLTMTNEEAAKAFSVMEEASLELRSNPSDPDYWPAVAWCLAAKVVLKKKRGPKQRWSRNARFALVTEVEKKLRKLPGSKKSLELPGIMEELRGDPRWPSDLTWKALERVYEDAKPDWERLEALAQAQGHSLLGDGWLLSG